MHKPKNISFTIVTFGLILICMFLWISHTFERKQKEDISEDIKKEIWRQIGLLEEKCNSTGDINHIVDISKPQLTYFRFVGNPAAPILIAVLLDKNKDWKLRFIIVQLLSKLKTKKALAPLEKILNDETDIKNIRVAATIALATLNFDEVIDILLKVAKGNDRELQLAAIYGLGELRKEEVVAELKKWVVNEKDEQIKKELELAIKNFYK